MTTTLKLLSFQQRSVQQSVLVSFLRGMSGSSVFLCACVCQGPHDPTRMEPHKQPCCKLKQALLCFKATALAGGFSETCYYRTGSYLRLTQPDMILTRYSAEPLTHTSGASAYFYSHQKQTSDLSHSVHREYFSLSLSTCIHLIFNRTITHTNTFVYMFS